MLFGHPLILLAIPPALGLLFWLVRRKDWFAGRRRGVLITTGAALLALLVALAGPAIDVRWGEVPTVLLVADDSPSMRTGQPWPQAARMVRDALPDGTRFGIVSFSGSSQVVAAPGRQGPTLIDLGRSTAPVPATNIEQALRSAMAVAGDPSRTALLLYSDGYETEGRALLAAAEARQRGFRLYTLPPAKPPEAVNASLLDVQAPQELRPAQKAALRVAIRSTRDARATVTLLDATATTPPVTIGRTEVDLKQGQTHWVEFPVEFAAEGLRTLEVALSGVAGDVASEDDRWPLEVQVGDRKPLLVVYYQSETASVTAAPPKLPLPDDFPPADRNPTAGEGPTPTVLEAAHLPLSAADLGAYAAVILDDVPAEAISAQARAALVEYVRDMGGGLLALGGENSFGLGGYPRTVIDDLLPVRSDPEDRPPVRVVLVLDRSASMGREVAGRQKLALAKEAALQISTLLNDKDRVGLVVFNHGRQTLAESVGTAQWDDLRRPLAAVRATGGTEIGPALEAALRLVESTPPAAPDGQPIARHVIAVSDGIVIGDDRKPPFDPAALAERARGLKTTISIVQTGLGSAWPGLKDLAEKSGGKFYDISSGIISATGRNRLERILLEDLDLPVLETTPAAVTLLSRAPLWPAEATIAAFGDLPEHLVTEAKQRATVHLAAGQKKRPILATWPYGLGRAAAWPVPRRGANSAWIAQPAVTEAYLRTVAWAARGPVAEADYDVSISARGGLLAATVDQRRLSDGLAAAPTMTLTLAGRGAGAAPLKFDLEPVAAGRWTLARSIPPGAYAYSLAAAVAEDAAANSGAESQRIVRRGTLSTGPSAEYRELDNHTELLERLAAEGGGEMLRSPTEASHLVMPAQRRVPLWPYLVAAAGLLMLWESVRELASRKR